MRIFTQYLPMQIILALFFIIIITGCTPNFSENVEVAQEDPREVIQEMTREVTREVTVEVTREVTSVMIETVEVPVTVTSSPTPKFTATVTQTPTITQTYTITPTPSKTPTETPTVTQTKPPGIGSEISCGEYFLIEVIEPPRKENTFYGEKAIGQFWLLKLTITNLMNQGIDLNDDDFIIQAELNGKKVEFESNWDVTFDLVYHNYGLLIYPSDNLVAGLAAKVGIGFDVNPNAATFKLVWFPRDNMFDDRSDALCEVEIPLE